MLDLDRLDLEMISEALADQSDYEHRWLIDPKTGEIVFWTSDTGIDGNNPVDPDELDLIAIDSLPSYVWYQDMADFVERVGDDRAARRLGRAIAGKGAFRRFKDELHQDYPDLLPHWHAFRDTRARHRAVEWLREQTLIDDDTAQTFFDEHPVPDPDRAEIGSDADDPGLPMVAPEGLTLLRTPGLATTVPYAYGAVTDPGRTLFTAGACPLDQEGNVVAVGDVAGQARQVMANLVAVLNTAGVGLTAVAKSTVYVATTDRADLSTAWEVVRAAFGDHDAPSTLLGVTVLGYSDQLVEVEAVAVLDNRDPSPQS